MRASLAVGLLAIASACGDSLSLPDASMGSDGPMRGLVKVHVALSNPIASRVIFQDANSSLVLLTRLDNAGDASAFLTEDRGFVTVWPDGGPLYTWTDVNRGDELSLDLSFPTAGETSPAASFRIEPLDGAFRYQLSTRCESVFLFGVDVENDMPVAPFFASCSATSDILLVAYDSSTQPLGFRYVKNALLTDPGPIDLRGAYLPIDSTVDVFGPAGVSISVTQRFTNLAFEASEFPHITDTHVVTPIGMPLLPGTSIESRATFTDFPFPPNTEDAFSAVEHTTFAWGPSAASTTLDLSNPDLRETTRPTLDIERQSLRWTEPDVGARGDAIWVEIGNSTFWTWIIIGPRTDATELRLPVLPFEDFHLREGVSRLDNFALLAADGGYDRMRSYLLGHWSPINAAWWPINGASGHASYRSVR